MKVKFRSAMRVWQQTGAYLGEGPDGPPPPPFWWNIGKRFIRKWREAALKSQIPPPPFLEFGFRPPFLKFLDPPLTNSGSLQVILFYSIPFHSILFYSIPFSSILFCSVHFYYVLFYYILNSIPSHFYSINSTIFCSVQSCSILFFVNSHFRLFEVGFKLLFRHLHIDIRESKVDGWPKCFIL